MRTLLLILLGFGASAQTVTNQSSHVTYPYNVTPYAIIEKKTGDTLSWYWNTAETKSYVTGLGYATSAAVAAQIPISIYTYSVSPLNHISAPVYSICITKDTGLYIKVLGTDSAGWFKAR